MKTPDVPAKGQFLLYLSEDGRTRIDMRLEGETVWLMQAPVSEFFQVGLPSIKLSSQGDF